MANLERQQTVQNLLASLSFESLKRLFWEDLNYARASQLYGLPAGEIWTVDPTFVPMNGTTAGTGGGA